MTLFKTKPKQSNEELYKSFVILPRLNLSDSDKKQLDTEFRRWFAGVIFKYHPINNSQF